MGFVMSVPFEFANAAITNVHEINSSFASGTLRVMYLGGNRNGSFFTKDAVTRALPSLKNVPIVCHWMDDAGEIGGHDIKIVSDDSGNMRIKNLTEPCGVVPDHAVFSFQKEYDESGDEHEYLVIDNVILWKRQDVFNHIKNDLGGHVKHSMEIVVNNSFSTDEGLVNIVDFEFTALCLLENCEPCFQGSALELYTAQHFKKKMEQMMEELSFALKEKQEEITTSSQEVDDIHPHNPTEGGEEVLEEKKALVEKFGLDVEALDFSIEDMTLEAIEEKLTAMQEVDTDNDNAEDNFALNSNITEELVRALGVEKVQRDWGESSRYWYVDCDLEQSEVYCWDTSDWLLYGFDYSVDGDAISIDYNSKKRMKYVIVPFEGEQASPFAPVFELMSQKIQESAEWESKYQDASATIESMQKDLDELNELRKYKLDVENEKMRQEREELFTQFDDLVGIEAFENLVEHCNEYDLDTLEEKLYAVRGRNGTTAKFAATNKSQKRAVDTTPEPESPYGDLFERYGPHI